jgi:hypothetical protein
MKPLRLLLIGLILLTLAGCGKRKIDGSSEAAFQRSLQSMYQDLGSGERRILSECILLIDTQGWNTGESGRTGEAARQRLRARLHRKTFEQIKAEAQRILAGDEPGTPAGR